VPADIIRKHQKPNSQVRYLFALICSVNGLQIQRIFTLTAGASGVIALTVARKGYRPVMPFAGPLANAELALLWFCFHMNATTGLVNEVIDIDDSTVAIQRAPRCKQRPWTVQRAAWFQPRLQPAAVRLHSNHLFLRSHGKSVRLGAFLTRRRTARCCARTALCLAVSVKSLTFQNNI
jgi:uncharacterized membrane protein